MFTTGARLVLLQKFHGKFWSVIIWDGSLNTSTFGNDRSVTYHQFHHVSLCIINSLCYVWSLSRYIDAKESPFAELLDLIEISRIAALQETCLSLVPTHSYPPRVSIPFHFYPPCVSIPTHSYYQPGAGVEHSTSIIHDLLMNSKIAVQ